MKNKNRLIIGILVITIVLLSSLRSIPLEVRGDSNYSNYLTSESVSVKNDRALILYESSTSSNNYRNYYETSFLFPSRLRDEMYSTELTTNPSKYYFQQAYLNDLDNEYAFSDVENLGQYETNDFIDNYSDIIENNGNYNNSDYESIEPEYKIIPNENIYTSSWSSTPLGSHYTKVNDLDDSDSIMYSLSHYGFEKLGFSNYNGICNNFSSLDIKFWSLALNTGMPYFQLYYGSDLYTHKIYCSFTGGKVWNTYSLTNYTFTKEQLNNLEIHFNFEGVTHSSDSYIYSIYINCYGFYPNNTNILQETDNNYYNYLSENSAITDDFDDDIRDVMWIDDANSGSITEQNNRLEMYTIGAMDWYTGVYNNPKSYIEVDTSNDFEFSVDLLTDSPNNHFQGLCIFDDDANAWLFSQITQAGVVKLWIRKIISGTATDIIDLVINRNYLKIEKINLEWFFKYSDDDISYTSLYDTNSLGINVDNVGLYHSSYVGASAFTSLMDNFEMNGNKLNISSQLQIKTNGNSYDNLEQLELEYTVKSNTSSSLDLYMYNINSQIFDLVDTKTITTSFQEFSYSYDLNYTYYNTLGISNFTFYIKSSYDSLISFDKINLKSVFSNFTLNSNGYHNINISFNRKTSGSVNRGNISLNLQLYQTYLTYDYIENNVIETDYSKMNQIINFSNDLLEPLIECEIQGHIRYGLNTLDIDIVNVYYEIILNYNQTYQIFEQLRFGNNDGNYFRYEFSYDAYNFNRLNNTGIFGNYSMNCLSGLRVLRGTTAMNYNRYFLIPFFDEKVSLTYTVGVSTAGTGSEPRMPSGTYWTYETFRLSTASTVGITVGNWTVDYNTVYAEKYDAKYPYKEKTLRRKDLGDWRFKTYGDYKISLNFLRNAVCDILNLIFLFFQYLGYYITAGLSYVFMYIGVNILVVIWNYLIFYIFIALIWVFWYLYLGLYALLTAIWEGLVWVYETLLLPFLEWLMYEFLPLAIEVFIIVWAFLITLLIYCMTLGQIDFDETYATVYDMLRTAADFIFENAIIILNNLPALFIAIGLYLVLIGLTYVKYLYAKARGYKDRAEALYGSIMTYLLPITLTYQIIRKIYDALPDSVA